MDRTGLRILVADDEPEVRDTFCKILTARGHEVCAAGDGRDCLRKLSQDVYDLVLLDLIMPELDGAQVLQSIRSHFPGTDVAILSAQDDESVIQELMKLGAIAFLLKPVDPNALIQLVDAAATNRMRHSTEAGIQRTVTNS